MGKLSNLRRPLASLPARLSRPVDVEGHSKTAEPWRKWYSLARWKRLRIEVFKRDMFTCQRKECGRLVGDTSKLVADHRQPHRGDPVLFWDDDNLQTLCKACHDREKQREERRATWA